MEKLLNKLEYRFGRYALANFTYYLVGAQAIVFVLNIMQPGFANSLTLDSHLVKQGEVWRLLTWLFIPLSNSPIWILFSLYWLYLMGTALESHWGAFKYQIYWFTGILGTALFAFILDIPVTNSYLLMSLFFAFATLWPNYELMIFFILPVKVKWLALLSGATLLYMVAVLPLAYKIIPILAVGNYFLFFTSTLIRMIRQGFFRAGHAKKFYQFKQSVKESEIGERRCPICGITDADKTAEFRVCNCEKCGKPTEYCIKHAWEH